MNKRKENKKGWDKGGSLSRRLLEAYAHNFLVQQQL